MTRTMRYRRAFALCAGLALAFPATGCGPKAPTTVSMRMTGTPKNASVTVDDEFVGTLDVVSARGVALPPGKHRITVEAAGYFPWDKVVEVAPGQGPVRLDAALAPIPD